nr:fibronectin type III domain-containing protein [Fictibacillus sp. 23RED33]
MLPVTKSFAYTGGSLEGKTLRLGTSITDNGIGTNNSTDGNETTGTTLEKNGLKDTLWYEFPALTEVFSLRLRAKLDTTAANNAVYVLYFDQNGVEIQRQLIQLSTAANTTDIDTPKNGVKKVAVLNPSPDASRTIYEFDVFTNTDTTPPKNVTALNSSNVTDTSFSVNWIKPNDLDYDKAEIYLDGALKGSVAATNIQNYSFSGLSSDRSFVVKVVSVDRTGNKSSGSTITVKTNVQPDTTAPGNVVDLTGTPTHNAVSLSWTNPPEQDFARVKVYENGVYKRTVTKDNTSALFENLQPETVYTFKVTSVDNTGNESTGSTIEVKTLKIPEISDITDLTAEAKFDRVKLSWKLPESEYFHHVNIYRKEMEDQSFLKDMFGSVTVSAATTEDGYTPMFETNGTYWTDLTVTPGTDYQYKLTAENTAGIETQGIEIETSTPQETPPKMEGVEYTENENGDYVVTWISPTTGKVKILVGGDEYVIVPAAQQTVTIPKEDLKYNTFGVPDVKVKPVSESGLEGEEETPPRYGMGDTPFSVGELLETGNGLLWYISPLLLLGLAFLLVPKLRRLITQTVEKDSPRTEKVIERRTVEMKDQQPQKIERDHVERQDRQIGREFKDKIEKTEAPGRQVRSEIRDREKTTSKIERRETKGQQLRVREARQKREPREVSRRVREARAPREPRKGRGAS